VKVHHLYSSESLRPSRCEVFFLLNRAMRGTSTGRRAVQGRVMQRLAMGISLLCILILVGCKMKPTVRQIADTIQINKGWTEIRPMPPLEVTEQVQRISIGVPDIQNWDIRPEDNTFVMPGGVAIKIEVELVAADGSSFMLQSLGLGPGLTFSYLPKGLGASASRLPKELRFASVRLRSDQPIQGGPVTWICVTNY
jgi:hypothetical protein